MPDWAEPVWHLYVVQNLQRDALQKALADAGVGTLIHYPIPPHLQQAYGYVGWAQGAFPLAERMANQVLSLPIGPFLSLSEADQVIESCKRLSASG